MLHHRSLTVRRNEPAEGLRPVLTFAGEKQPCLGLGECPHRSWGGSPSTRNWKINISKR